MSFTVTLLTSAADPESAAIAAALERVILTSQDAIEDASLSAETAASPTHRGMQVQIVQVESLPDGTGTSDLLMAKADLLCPLTLENSAHLPLPHQALYQACRHVEGLRAKVCAQGFSTGPGDLWLPIVLTAKGPLYGEAIGLKGDAFQQPIHLSDALRQPAYRLGRWLLSELSAPPAVYLLQMAIRSPSAAPEIVFDRLWPFPAAPALASQGRQSPDLMLCHWRCLTQQPIRDLQVRL